MKRRALLHAAGVAGIGLLAGCTGEESEPGDAPTDSRTETPNPSSSPSPTPSEPTLESKTFEVVSNACGSGDNDADATVSPTGDRTPTDGGERAYTVTVTGTIDGSDTCHTARLAAVKLDPASDALRVEVESYVPDSEETPVCGQCIVDIDYEATFEFAGGHYGVVVVVHGGEVIAEISLSE